MSHCMQLSAPNEAMPMQTILMVDDTPQNLTILGELLRPTYRVRAANSGERALRAAHSDPRPDLILLDVMMSGMDGHEVMRRLRQDPLTCDIPVIFITALSSAEDESLGLELGAVDYITKPFNGNLVLARVRTHLELQYARHRLAQQEKLQQRESQQRSSSWLIQELHVRALACLTDRRDNATGLHLVRAPAYFNLLATKLSDHLRFQKSLEGRLLDMTVKAALLHDIGMVQVSDAIVQKPGHLTAAEFEIIQGHTVHGAEAINKAIAHVLSGVDERVTRRAFEAFEMLHIAKDIALSHHEKWDGSGYPHKIAGDAIPVAARLMAVADVFDALMSQRAYKPALSFEQSSHILQEGRASHFDPDVVDAFLALQDQFAEIATRFADFD